jgi:hypothetical protein
MWKVWFLPLAYLLSGLLMLTKFGDAPLGLLSGLMFGHYRTLVCRNLEAISAGAPSVLDSS